MLAYFGIQAAAKKAKPEKPFIDERLIHIKDYFELGDKLQAAKDKIQELETLLATKEQLQNELHKKIELLTVELEQEKSNIKVKQTQFAAEEDTLNEEIASLKLDLLRQESHYEVLRSKIINIQLQQEEQLKFQEKYTVLQSKMDEKEREYEILVNKITKLNDEKKDIEERLTQEKKEHKETKSALEMEKNARNAHKTQTNDDETKTSAPLPNVSQHSTTLFNPNHKQKSYAYYFPIIDSWQLFPDF